MRSWLLLLALPAAVLSMRVDPERIAARLRIEGEGDFKTRVGRGRRQSPLAKEISIQVTAPLFSSRLFEYGKDVGDTEVPQSLDVGKKVDLSQPISFFGSDYDTVYVLSNGGIGFEPSSRSHKQGILPSNTKMIAPFWNRNDLRNGGHVYYRVVKKGRVLERGASEINYQYGVRVKVNMALIVTWEKMQPLGEKTLPEDNTNIFQAAIFITDNGTYANFIYNNIGWTQGAEAGFNQGDGTRHFALPTSGTGNIMYLEENGNTGIPGEWIFELGASRVVRCKAGWKGETCDQQCTPGEWGADCVGCCHCASGATCNNVTGECASGCSECWTGASCQTKKPNCQAGKATVTCAANAIQFSDNDRCGEPVQRCQCLAGFKGDGLKGCHDIDECRQQPGICHPQATCTNTPGHYFCQCKAGFQGDGVKECSTSFLYSSDGHQSLPKSKNSKVTWQLRNPLKVMGQLRDKLTITTSGLIALNDVIDVGATRLDDTHMTGVAPFFAPIDISASGTVTVAEITENDVLSRAKREIEQQYGTVFHPKSMVLVTYSNVSDGNSQKGNTFQTAFIGGIDGNKEQTTFVQLLYKDMPWAEKAEAGIMTNEVSSSVALPGSGTEGLSQLPQLSNVGRPGIWMYRIDETTVQPCPQEDRQPPYCDQPSLQKARQNLNKKSEDLRLGVEVEGPRTIIPTLDSPTPRMPVERKPSFTSAPPRSATTSRPRPRFESTPHRPLVSLGQEDFEVDPDVFEAVAFPPAITVRPEVVTKGRKLPDFTQSSSTSTTTTTTSTTTTTEATTTTAKPTTEPTFPTFAVEEVETVAPKKQNFADLAVAEKTTTKEAPDRIEELIVGEADDAVVEVESTTPQKPIFVFTQAPKVTTRPTPLPPPPKRPANIVTARTTTEAPLEERTDMAIMIPAAIVLVWMALIGVIIVVVCCRRRNTANMHSIYGPTYGVRPTGYAPKRGSKHLEGAYEDHLEKAARLSTEMGAYGQPPRLSLYGSYWNLNNSSSSPGSGPSTRHSPPFNNHTRYTYTGRY